jgi:phage terminase large subunit
LIDQKEAQFTRIFEKNRDAKALVVINVGGARSSKSYSLTQLIIYKLLTEHHKTIGICRKTFPALRMTCMKDFFTLLKDYGIYDERKHNKTFNTYEYADNFVQFFGLDESEKIKSTGFSYIWMEEANEFTYEDYINLKLRLSNPTTLDCPNHLYLSFNPIDESGWIPKRAVKESDVEVIHSTFLDNPFLSEEYKKSLLDLVNQDENFYRVYALGQWGKLEGLIYRNYQIIPNLPNMTGAKWCYGLDFGLVNPTAIVKVYLLEDKFYLEERFYERQKTNADIIEFFSHEEKGDIYFDPTSKQMGEEISRAGFSAWEGHRGVKESIDLAQRQTLYIPTSSVNLVKEIQGYSWRKDPNGTDFLPEPVKFNDHLCDSFRYAIWGMTERYGFATQRPRPAKPISTLTFNPIRR